MAPSSLRRPARRRVLHPRPDPVVEGHDHLIEVDLLIIEVADNAALVDVEPDRPDMEIVVSGDPEDHVLLLVTEGSVNLALDDTVRLTGSVHLHVHFDPVPPAVQQVATIADAADGVVRNGLTRAPFPSKSAPWVVVPITVVP